MQAKEITAQVVFSKRKKKNQSYSQMWQLLIALPGMSAMLAIDCIVVTWFILNTASCVLS